jgi:hypothetical protein
MTIKDLFNTENVIISYAIACVIVCGAIFLAGRYSAPYPSKDLVCGKEMEDVRTHKATITRHETKIGELEAQIRKCEDSCDTRLRNLSDRKDREAGKSLADALNTQKQRFLNFKCTQCKRQGYCK